MPAEQRAPDAHVEVWLRNARDVIRLHSGVEAAFDLTQIPGGALIEKRIRLICSIDRRLIA